MSHSTCRKYMLKQWTLSLLTFSLSFQHVSPFHCWESTKTKNINQNGQADGHCQSIYLNCLSNLTNNFSQICAIFFKRINYCYANLSEKIEIKHKVTIQIINNYQYGYTNRVIYLLVYIYRTHIRSWCQFVRTFKECHVFHLAPWKKTSWCVVLNLIFVFNRWLRFIEACNITVNLIKLNWNSS